MNDTNIFNYVKPGNRCPRPIARSTGRTSWAQARTSCVAAEAALCGEVPATASAEETAEREAFAEELRRIAKQNRSLRYVVGILVLICGVLTMLSGYRSLQNSKAPSNEITTPAPLPDTITISGLTLDIDGIALVFRFQSPASAARATSGRRAARRTTTV